MENYNVRIDNKVLIFSTDNDFFEVLFYEDDYIPIRLGIENDMSSKLPGSMDRVWIDRLKYIKFAFSDGSGWCYINNSYLIFKDDEQRNFNLKFKMTPQLKKCFEELIQIE